jgi:hypothetical protein
MKTTTYLIVALATLPLILSACGGGSGGGSSATIPAAPAPQTINGISVPPEPDPVANNATLAGVDSNGNGVRDDVERRIATASTSEAQFSVRLAIAKEYQKTLVAEKITANEINAREKIIGCMTIKNINLLKDGLNIKTLITDTENRKSMMRAKVAKSGGVAIGDEECQ